MEEGDYIHGENASFEVTVKKRKRNIRETLIAANNRPESMKTLKKTQNSVASTLGDTIDILLVEEHLRKTGFLSNNWLIHQRRTEGDILYGLFFFPRSIITTVDEETGDIKEIELITKICNDVIEYFEMRYEESLTEDYMIRSVFSYLRTTTNTRIKLFAILYMMTLEPPIVRYLTETCGVTGFKTPKDYKRVVNKMEIFIHRLTHGTMVEKTNINSIVNDMIMFAIYAYLTVTTESRESQNLLSTRKK